MCVSKWNSVSAAQKMAGLTPNFIPRSHCKNHAEQENIECPKYWKLYGSTVLFPINFY